MQKPSKAGATCRGFDHLGVPLQASEKCRNPRWASFWANTLRLDNVTISVFGETDSDPLSSWWSGKPLHTPEPKCGRVIDHIGFSFREIEPVFERLSKAGVTIGEPLAIREDYGPRAFRGAPDNVLIEFVEARPNPDAVGTGRGSAGSAVSKMSPRRAENRGD